MEYSPDTHHRRSIRLKGYDYSRMGAYFITICTQNRKCLFGEIVDEVMIINPCGDMVVKWVRKTEEKFDGIDISTFVVMPNHFHAIVVNTATAVGADPRVRPPADMPGNQKKEGRHMDLPLQGVVQWFKTMTTNEYIRGVRKLDWEPFDKKLWQRNYYEHIIRNEKSYSVIADYIQNNPKRWLEDDLYCRDGL